MNEFQPLYLADSAGAVSQGPLVPEAFGPERLPELYPYPDPVPDRGWVRANMLSTVDGAVTGPDGLSGSISGPPDRHLLVTLRHTSDAVLVGVGTTRAEGYRRVRPRAAFAERRAAAGQRPAPTLVVVTGSGEVPDRLVETSAPDDGDLLVLVSEQTPTERVRALRARLGEDAIVVAGESQVDPDTAVDALVSRGLRRIGCEGGPTWLGLLAAAGRLDELCLTTSPVLVGGSTARILHGAPLEPSELHLQHVLLAGGLLFTRWLTIATADPVTPMPAPE